MKEWRKKSDLYDWLEPSVRKRAKAHRPSAVRKLTTRSLRNIS